MMAATPVTYVLRGVHGAPVALARTLPVGVEPEQYQGVVVCTFVNSLCDVVKPAAVLQRCADGFGVAMPRYRFVWAQLPNLGAACCSTVFLRGNLPQPCVCSLIPDLFKLDGHLCTGLGGWTGQLPAVRMAVDVLHCKGLLHVPAQPVDVQVLISEYCRVLAPVLEGMVELDEVLVADVVRDAVLALLPASALPSQDLLVMQTQQLAALGSSLCELGRLVFVSASDKAATHAIFACKRATLHRVREQVFDAAVYAPATAGLDALREAVHTLMPAVQFAEPEQHAVLFPLFKPHKLNFRFISAFARVSVGELAQVLARMCGLVYDEQRAGARDLALKVLVKHGLRIRLDNVMQDSLQAACNLPQRVAVPVMEAADVVKCYDSMSLNPADPHSIPSRLGFIVQLVSQRLGPDARFWVRRTQRADKPAKWRVLLDAGPHPGHRAVHMHELPGLVHRLLSNCLIEACGVLWRATAGCPQGLAPCPVLVNMFLLSYDVEYVRVQQHSEHGRWCIQQLYTHMFKLLDDVLVVGGQHVQQLLPTVYPPMVRFEFTTNHQPGVAGAVACCKFLNMCVTVFGDGRVHRVSFDKAAALPFTPVKFVQGDACRSKAAAIGVLLGQLLPAVVLNSDATGVRQHFRRVLEAFIHNGFNAGDLLRAGSRKIKSYDFSNLTHVDVLRAWRSALPAA